MFYMFQVLTSSATEGILNCTEYKSFWITWKEGKIHVGSGGVVGQKAFMSYVDPNPYDVIAIAAASTDIGGATWHFTQFTGSVDIFLTHSTLFRDFTFE